jgi:hypothetical protein
MYGFEFAKFFDKFGVSAVPLTPLVRYNTASAGDLDVERLWLSLKGISIKKLQLKYLIAIKVTQKI